MKINLYLFVILLVLVVSAFLLVSKNSIKNLPAYQNIEAAEEEKEAHKASFVKARMKYEYDMLKNPITGKIPAGIFEQEKVFARSLPVRIYDAGSNNNARTAAANTYIPAGPNNIGGRTRAVAYDLRFNGTSNQVIIAGSVSGGIMRSADGGNSWTRVSPENEIHNLTALAQDPLTPDIWYAGGGEHLGNTASEVGAFYLGFGIYKSINNGLNWTRLPLTVTDVNGSPLVAGTLETFDNPFDLVHRIAVNPVNGHVYIAGHRRLVRSTNGGTTFNAVFAGNVPAGSTTGQTEVVISNTGRIFLGVDGGNPDPSIRGVWVSNTGDVNSFTRIAGGQTPGVDSVANWRGNAYDGSSKRIVLAVSPSNGNIAYAFYENGLSSSAPELKPEADFFRLDISGTSFTWTNRSANMPDFPPANLPGSDPLSVQGGYDMEVSVKPDDPNVVFVGGTNLYRSIDGFATTTNTAWIGGYSNVLNSSNNFTYGQYPQSHPDIHRLTFHPTNAARAICANDGGIQETVNILAGTVTWTMLPNYQTLQCYNVSIDPGAGRNNFASGSQDNGVRFRDRTGVLGTATQDSNNHRLLFSADGAYVGISLDNAGTQYLYESIQLGRLYRARLTNPFAGNTEITPAGLTTSSTDAGANEFGEFVTNLRLEADNSDNLYYVNFNRLFRTTSASTVTSATWTELTGVSAAINPANPTGGRNISIRGIGFSRGPYASSHALYLGTTNGKIFRIDNPQNATPATSPIDITPTGLTGNVQDIATNPNNDDEIIAVVSNYGVVSIWWTKNAKSASPTWKNAEGNLTIPSIRSCAIIVKKDAANQPVTEYYVGTSVGLYSTINLATVLDAGQAPVWQREGGNMLNYSVVTSLAYRPADNVLLLGTHGNGIYYTNLGTPNFTPNLNTAITPVTNDRNFIKNIFPTVSANNIQYQIGNMIGIRKISVQIINLNGQIVYREDKGYQNGSVPLQRLASGAYILSIYSDDNKYRHIQKVIKQ